ncbi:MAG: S24 family peptidase [Phycisphaerales bacterium]
MLEASPAQASVGRALGQGAVGVVIRARREELGLSLQAVAARVGCAKSYLSAIENHRRGTPSDVVLARIEGALGLPEGSLVENGRWLRSLEAGGESVQRDVQHLRAAQQAGRRLAELLARHAPGDAARKHTLDAAYQSGELRRLVEQLAPQEGAQGGAEGSRRGAGNIASLGTLPLEVPLINRVAAGYPREFTDLGYPARCADEYVRCPDVEDPDAFAARVVGDSMMPAYAEGDIVIFSPVRALASGMDCFARIEPDHETTFKRVYFETDARGREVIRLQPLNNAYPPRVLSREDVAGLYAAVRVIKQVP